VQAELEIKIDRSSSGKELSDLLQKLSLRIWNSVGHLTSSKEKKKSILDIFTKSRFQEDKQISKEDWEFANSVYVLKDYEIRLNEYDLWENDKLKAKKQ